MTTIEPVDPDTFRALAGEAAGVYGEAMDRSPEVVVQRRDLITQHAGFAGFLASGAFDADTPIDPATGRPRLLGFGYGYPGRPGQWWHDVVAGALGREATKRWLTDGFELAELHVLPDHQGHGLGRMLLDDLFARVEARQVVLSTPDTDSRARSLYRSFGFTDLRRGFRFPGSDEDYAIMGVDR
jgi:ribosomal protein S18 acetylase RimI-like enzyme